MKLLMLDLEGVLISDTDIFLRPEGYWWIKGIDRFIPPRPEAEEFLEEANELFDIIYLNTLVGEERAYQVINKITPDVQVRYWHHELENKTTGYERLQEHTVIHLEDGVSPRELAVMEELGIHYIQIKDYNDSLAERVKDEELPKALEKIYKLL